MFTQHSTKNLAIDGHFSALARLCAWVLIIFCTICPAATSADSMNTAANNVSGLVQSASNQERLDYKDIQKRLQALDNAFATQNRQIQHVLRQLQSIQDENHWLKMALLGMSMLLAASGYFFADWLKRKTVQHALPEKSQNLTQTTPIVAAKPSPLQSAPNPASNATTNIAVAAPAEVVASERLQTNANAAVAENVLQTPFNPPLHNQPLQNQGLLQTRAIAANTLSNASLTRLQKHLMQSPKQSARTWLYLLDKLKSEGLQADYAATAAQCKIHFNLQTEPFLSTSHSAEEAVTLESFPRLMNTLNACWGTPAALSFLDDLIYNTRPMPRIGFNRYVFEELLMLRDIAALTQNIPRHRNKSTAFKKHNDLTLLSQIEQDISSISAPMMNTFQYWSAFSFVLDEPQYMRKLA